MGGPLLIVRRHLEHARDELDTAESFAVDDAPDRFDVEAFAVGVELARDRIDALVRMVEADELEAVEAELHPTVDELERERHGDP